MWLTTLLGSVVPSAGSKFGGNVDILIDGFVPPSSSVAPMFPFFENTSEWDDFGEVINPEDYLMKQEEMDNTLMPVSLLMYFFSFFYNRNPVARWFNFAWSISANYV